MNFRPFIKLTAIFYFFLPSIKNAFVLPLFPYGFAQGKPFSLFLLPLFCFTFAQTLGDLNNDESINVLDILRTINIILEIPPPPSEQETIFGDLNVDDVIDITDIIIIVDIIIDNLDAYCEEENNIPCVVNYSECCYPSLNPEFAWDIYMTGCGFYNVLNDISITENEDYIAVGPFSECDIIDEEVIYHNYDALIYENDELTPTILFGDSFQMVFSDILYFDENNIWVIGWTYPSMYNGTEWILHNFQDLGFSNMIGCEKMWGTSPDNIYCVGPLGTILHYENNEWNLIGEGVTDHSLKSIHGNPDGSHIFVTGWNNIIDDPLFPYGTVALEIVDDEVSILYEDTDLVLGGIYGDFIPNVAVLGDTAYFGSAEGLWKYNYFTQESIILRPPEIYHQIFPRSGLFVNTPNDIIIGGASYFYYVVFNGAWHSSSIIGDMIGHSSARGSDYKNNKFYMVGNAYGGQKIVVARGYRQE